MTDPDDIYDYCGKRIWDNGEHEDPEKYMGEAHVVQYKKGEEKRCEKYDNLMTRIYATLRTEEKLEKYRKYDSNAFEEMFKQLRDIGTNKQLIRFFWEVRTARSVISIYESCH